MIGSAIRQIAPPCTTYTFLTAARKPPPPIISAYRGSSPPPFDRVKMCRDSRAPQTTTITAITQRRQGVPVPTTAATTAITDRASPHVTSTTETRPARWAAYAVSTIARKAMPIAIRAGPHQVSTMSPAPFERQRVVAAGAHAQDLVDAHPAVAERQRAADEVEPPDAHHLLADQVGQLGHIPLEVLQPAGHGAHVVFTEAVHVAHLEAAALEQRDGLADGAHVHVGRDESLDEGATAGVRAGARHLLHQHPAAGSHRSPQHVDVRRVAPLADVLAHLQRADGVEGAFVGRHHLAVVLEPDLDPSLEPALADAGVDEPLLLARDRDPHDLRAEVLRGVQRERPPAAADVEQGTAGSEVELAADQVELRALRRLDALPVGVARVVSVIAAGVGHRGVEQQGVEVVGKVVVVTDRAPVALPAVQTPSHAGLRGGGWQGLADDADRPDRPHRFDVCRWARPAGQPARTTHLEDVAQRCAQVAVHLELAGHVGLCGAELTRVPQQPAQGVGGAQLDQRSVDRAGLRAVPGP